MGTSGLHDICTLSPQACGPRASVVYIMQATRAHGITHQCVIMCGRTMDSLYLYRDLLDYSVGLNLMIKHIYDVILKSTIKSCKAHYIKE